MPEIETVTTEAVAQATPGATGGNGAQTFDRAEVAARIERERTQVAAQTRTEVLRELGLDSDEALAKHRASREAADKQQPEIERREREWKKQFETLTTERTQLTLQIKAANDAYLAVLIRSHAGEISRSIDAHDGAVSDVETWLDGHTVTEGEGEGAALMVSDGDFKVEYDSKDWLQKVGDHLRKTKPHYSRSRVVGGAGTSLAGQSKAPTHTPENLDELAAAFARKAASGR